MRHESDRQSLREHPQEPHKIANGSAPARVDFSIECAVPARYEWYVPLKGAADCLLGVLLLVITAPITLLAAIAIKLTSRGPAFYCQTRQGRNGNPFTLYKLRTMVDKAEAATGPIWSTKDDARVTRLGAVLRKTHIDEFPQLVNVICGEMSLIGPRPERPEIAATLEWQIPYYRRRLEVRPGITGFAQVRLPPDTDLESVRRKVMYDLYYVRNVNPWLDLRLLCATGWCLIREVSQSAWTFIALPGPTSVRLGLQPIIGAGEFTESSMDPVPDAASTMSLRHSV